MNNRTPNHKYYGVIQSLEARGGINSLNEFCREHKVSTALTTSLHKAAWIRHGDGGYVWVYCGPMNPSKKAMDEIIHRMRTYAIEHRKDAPSQKPGARQERRERAVKRQGHRSDIIPFPQEKIDAPQKQKEADSEYVTFSILWGLFEYKKRIKP